MNRKKVSIENTSLKDLFNKTIRQGKENVSPRNKFAEKIFKTPEKKHISIENSSTTVTMTNYFKQCKYSIRRESVKKSEENVGLERKIVFDDEVKYTNNLKFGKNQSKSRYLSSSPKKTSPISITYSDLKNRNFKLYSKCFNSSLKRIVSARKSLERELDDENLISEDSLFEQLKEKENETSDFSEKSVDSDVCCHQAIPFNKVNDELFKTKAICKLRKTEIPSIKSVNCKFYEYKRRPFEYGLLYFKIRWKFDEI